MTRYRPSNTTEGDAFYSRWCTHCERDRANREDECAAGCKILSLTMLFDVDDPEYPSEWVICERKIPRCTAYVPEGEPIQERCAHTLDMFEASCN